MLTSLRARFVSNALAGVAIATTLLVALPARATPCVVPIDCPSGFCVDKVCCDTKCDGACEACSAVAKGGGADGTCGLAAAGKVCAEASCGGANLDYVGPSKCDAAGTCVAPPAESCLHNDPCHFDLCDTGLGCDQVTKNDGSDCDGGMVCNNGVCGAPMSTSASSSSSSSSSASSTSSSSSGAGGAGGASTGGYPPSHPGTCGCRVGQEAPAGGATALSAALLALLFRSGKARPRRARSRYGAGRARSSRCRATAR